MKLDLLLLDKVNFFSNFFKRKTTLNNANRVCIIGKRRRNWVAIGGLEQQAKGRVHWAFQARDVKPSGQITHTLATNGKFNTSLSPGIKLHISNKT
ncbi:hypothetical protein TcasGA2_TC006781 [Tribolium castaneum]|uniref:Uncharacterized protein n=1 Tax=Tribolium castaneum TaxID=7070 RepID=D6WUU7_TRICA|nr:hypothetical protein TcasGA2_TC006781 [Tribolium castaneum]